MREPIVVHCQCGDPGCDAWVHLREDDAALIGPGCSVLCPGHAHPTDRICDIRGAYVIVEAGKATL
jgi:hypothetical protein